MDLHVFFRKSADIAERGAPSVKSDIMTVCLSSKLFPPSVYPMNYGSPD